MKILADMNVPVKYVSLLESKGFDVVHWANVGAPNASDNEIMNFARENNCVVLTFDLDFGAILSVTREKKPSVIQIRTSLRQAERAVELIAASLNRHVDELNDGAIISIDLNAARLRILPL